MGDPFRVIDGIFSGLVQFCLNVFSSIWSLLRDPLRGTLRLTARYTQTPIHQVSYLTLLFLLAALSYCVYEVVMEYPMPLARRYEGMYTLIGKNMIRYLTGSDVFRLALYGIIFTSLAKFAVDGTLRKASKRTKIRNKSIVHLRAGYFLVFCFSLWLLCQLSMISIAYFCNLYLEWELEVVTFLFFVVGGTVLVAVYLYRSRRLFPVGMRGSFGAAAFSVLLGNQLGAYSYVRVFDAFSRKPVELIGVDCRTTGNRIEIQAVGLNHNGATLILASSRVRIVGMLRSDAQHITDEEVFIVSKQEVWVDVDRSKLERLIPIEPNKPFQLRVTSNPLESSHNWHRRYTCGLSIELRTVEATLYAGNWPFYFRFRAEGFEPY
jgi:hypothetical protein